MKVKIIRLLDDGFQTLGQLLVFDGLDKIFECKTLELSWKDNKSQISCIPTGVYHVKKTYSNTFQKELFQVMNVPGRDGIRIHAGNYVSQIKGCILPGQSFYDINKDSLKDVTSSQKTLENLEKLLIFFELQII